MANITVRSGCLAVAVDLQGNIAMVGTEGEVCSQHYNSCYIITLYVLCSII